MGWQQAVREELDPIDADNEVARMEEKIRRALKRGPKKDRDLKRAVHAHRAGTLFYDKAVKNLSGGISPDIEFIKKTKEWHLSPNLSP